MGWTKMESDGSSTSIDGWRKSRASIAVLNSVAKVYLVDCTVSAQTVNLPPLAQNLGRLIIVSKTDSSVNAVTIDPNAAETINGAATDSLASQYSTMFLLGTDSTWVRVSEL